MELAVNKLSALRVLRKLRSARELDLARRRNLPAPDPSPRMRWTAGMVPLEPLALNRPPCADRPLDVAVPSAAARLQASFASCTVYSRGLPEAAFLEVGEGLLIPSPELVFIEMGALMPLAVQVLVGYELCGTYARDAADPRDGTVTYGLRPATSTSRISQFLDVCQGVRSVRRARAALAYVADNAWSPMEAVIAALAVLPPSECGYGFHDVALNVRHENESSLVETGLAARSRVPDIELVPGHVGINYDGQGHLELAGLVDANGQGAAAQEAKFVRAKYVDDLRRNRELTAQGLPVLPVVAEDLYQVGGLDAVMLEVAQVAELLGGTDMGELRKLLRIRAIRSARQHLIWSLLPGERGKHFARQQAWNAEHFGEPRKVIEATIVL